MSSNLGHVWFSSVTAGLTQLSRPKGGEMRQWPYIVRAEDKYKVGHYKEKISIILVLVLAITPLAITYVVIYVYSK